MAANLLPFRATVIGACASSGQRRPDPNGRKSASSANWWTPLFGWSSEPDYIDSGNDGQVLDASEKPESKANQNLGPKPPRSRFTPGCFTEEKARQLRMMTKETESFHDAMYHSAIASRLASDFKNDSDL
ncbi:hypothetical protein CJ030_MR6G010466 [Morella rubra]|uniref:Uncharacterized protein n=1 Tax=Morella rubra TaxID=262757 RepID=A0A6A1VB45_9ROSI|nr:hypothetical protein CJ030_MR6G010466 [Morella rubra]